MLEEGSTLGVINETGSRMSHSKGLISFSSGICILTRSKMLGLPSCRSLTAMSDRFHRRWSSNPTELRALVSGVSLVLVFDAVKSVQGLVSTEPLIDHDLKLMVC